MKILAFVEIVACQAIGTTFHEGDVSMLVDPSVCFLVANAAFTAIIFLDLRSLDLCSFVLLA